MKIWQRFLFGYLIRAFFFFLVVIIVLYIAIDFSMHSVRFLSKETTSWIDIGTHYLRHFAKFTPLFFSLSFLLAMLRVLLDLGAHGEIVALQTAGLSTRQLLSPFLFLASLLALVSYANFQWISPEAGTSANDFYRVHSIHEVQKGKVFFFVLQDGSELVYQKYDHEKRELFDVFWIRSFEEIWHMKTVKIGIPKVYPSECRFADRFTRKSRGALEKTDSIETRPFPELVLEEGAVFQEFIPFENRSLTTLLSQAAGNSSDKQRSAAHLHYKLAQPLVPFLMIAAFAPFALRYSRSRSALLFVACSLFAFIGLLTIFDGMLILAENQAVPILYAIWSPLGLGFCAVSFFSRKILKN